MKNKAWFPLAFLILFLAPGCRASREKATALPTQLPQTVASKNSAATLESGKSDPAQACPPGRGQGTISPAVSFACINFVVNGSEPSVRAGGTLKAAPGDHLRVKEITICVGEFSGKGGEICVDFVPVDQGGQELVSLHAGTHMLKIVAGFVTVSGPDYSWTIGDNWRSFSAMLNHWPPEDTLDFDCGNRRCEHDDRILIEIR